MVYSELGAHAKFQNPKPTLLGEVYQMRRKREKNTLLMATTFYLQHPRAAHALGSDQHKEIIVCGATTFSYNQFITMNHHLQFRGGKVLFE